jgi:hypothetical protein
MNLGLLAANNKNTFITRYQSTGDIAGAIIKAIKDSERSADHLSSYFKNSDPYKSCKLIFMFCKNLLPYNMESADKQTARTLNRILQDSKKGVDCKHYTTVCAALCKALNIPCVLRLISQRPTTKQPNHIYCVAFIKGKEVILDPVLKHFDTEARYNYKFDIKIK